MNKKPLDPNLASILDSIRATVGGETVRPTEEALEAMLAAEGELAPDSDEGASSEILPHAKAKTRQAAAPAPAGKPVTRKTVPAATRTVEDFLAELIRPQVDAWLSAHLPEIIQKQAAEEIARLTGKKSG